jgi:hypothetical protein
VDLWGLRTLHGNAGKCAKMRNFGVTNVLRGEPLPQALPVWRRTRRKITSNRCWRFGMADFAYSRQYGGWMGVCFPCLMKYRKNHACQICCGTGWNEFDLTKAEMANASRPRANAACVKSSILFHESLPAFADVPPVPLVTHGILCLHGLPGGFWFC